MKSLYIYGARAIIEALNNNVNIEKIWIDKRKHNNFSKEIIFLSNKANIPIQFVPEEKLNSFKNKNHQGFVAKISLIEYQILDNIIENLYSAGQIPFILILDHITDIRNFGAIARTALSAGVHAIVIDQKRQAPINEDAIKTSAGALLKIPVCREKSLIKVIDKLHLHGIKIISCTEKSSEKIYNIKLNVPVAIIMGNEEKGINPTILKKSDHCVAIPMYGPIASLNVSVATGIILYECVRQRNYSL